MLVDVLLQDFGESFGQGSGPQVFSVNVSVDGMASEVLLFLVECNWHFDFVVNVLLRTVLNSYKSQLERNLLVQNHLAGICTSIHDVDFGDHTQSPRPLRVPSPGQVQPLWSRHVSIGRDHCQDDRSFLGTIPLSHLYRDLLNVLLMSNWDSGDTRQIDQG